MATEGAWRGLVQAAVATQNAPERLLEDGASRVSQLRNDVVVYSDVDDLGVGKRGDGSIEPIGSDVPDQPQVRRPGQARALIRGRQVQAEPRTLVVAAESECPDGPGP